MLRTVAWSSFAFALGGLIAFGCQKADDRAANLDRRCDAGAKCAEPPPIGGVGGSGGIGSDVATDGATTTISGSVALVTGDDFTTAIQYVDPATIELESGSGTPISGSYDGEGFSVSDVRVASDLWATVTPTAGGDVLRTLQPIDTTRASPFQLLVVQGSLLEQVFAALPTPTAPAVGDAQIVLHFVDAQTGDPIPGVSVSYGAEATAYDIGGSYSDLVTETGPAGTAILINVPALAVPSKQKVMIQAPSGAGAVEILMQADAVTLTDVFINP